MFQPKAILYEPGALEYPLGKEVFDRYSAIGIPFEAIENHNNIESMRKRENSDFPEMKQYLILATRKTHKYTENQKVSDFLVPYTSSGCTASCLYCYLVCHYNKCSYLRLFVNREQMLQKIIKTAHKSERDLTFEIGSNSDLILENTITGNLEWTIPQFAQQEKGFLTFPTKFSNVAPLLDLDHRGRTIVRMSVNPPEIIRDIELHTSNLIGRIRAINELADAGYPVGILVAPVILVDNYQQLYTELFEILSDTLSEKAKSVAFFEVIFMTYSYVHRMINQEAFPDAPNLFSQEQMTGRGKGKYVYRQDLRAEGEEFLRKLFVRYFPENKILYFS